MTDLISDERFMRQAMELSAKARITAPPNPWVGCVIVKNGEIIGQGYTLPPGEAHAEINALKQAGEQAKDSTLYATLEPCSHFGRTPPCVNAIIKAGVKRVVIGIEDPDTHVRGKGIEILKNAGLQVEVGISAEQIRAFLAPYLYHRQTGLPYCMLKAAVSMDGRMAASDGTSKWITSSEARADVYRLRAESQAIMIGAGTASKDHPKLTIRDVEEFPLNSPLRVVLDGKGQLGIDSPLFDLSLAPTLIATTVACPQEVLKRWASSGAEIIIVPQKGRGNVDIHAVLENLGKRGILQVMVEGGSALMSACIQEKHLQKLCLYTGNCLLGSEGLPFFKLKVDSIQEAPRFRLIGSKIFETDFRMDYVPIP